VDLAGGAAHAQPAEVPIARAALVDPAAAAELLMPPDGSRGSTPKTTIIGPSCTSALISGGEYIITNCQLRNFI
jgi:hypothetical protein